jgi:hypothetical protein
VAGLITDSGVRRVQLGIGNVRQVATWMQEHGGGVAGLAWRDTGTITERGIFWGTLEGAIVHARIGDWIIRDRTGEFDAYETPPSCSFSYEWVTTGL